jgi:hypothetical protein
VLDPFTNENRTLKPIFPGIYGSPPSPSWDGWGETVYDSTVSEVVYIQGDVDGPYYYVLWNIQKAIKVVDIQVIGEFNGIPHWSPDGKQFAVAPSMFSNRGFKSQVQL